MGSTDRHLNANGGINGRTVEAVYDFHSAIDGTDADRSCAALTQDQDVFAVLGGFVGPLAGTADPCIVGLNETFLIGGEQTADELSQAVAPWYHPAATGEAVTASLLDLLIETGRTDGAQVFTIGDVASEAQQEGVIAELEARDIEVVGSGIVEAGFDDPLAALLR